MDSRCGLPKSHYDKPRDPLDQRCPSEDTSTDEEDQEIFLNCDRTRRSICKVPSFKLPEKAAGRTRLSICKAPSFKLPEEGCRQGAGQVKPSSTLLCHKVLSLMCASFEAAGTGFFVGAYCFVRKCIVLYQCMSNLHKLNRAGCPSVLAKKALRRCVVCHFQLPKCLQQKA